MGKRARSFFLDGRQFRSAEHFCNPDPIPDGDETPDTLFSPFVEDEAYASCMAVHSHMDELGGSPFVDMRGTIAHESLPFRMEVKGFYRNSKLQPLAQGEERPGHLADAVDPRAAASLAEGQAGQRRGVAEEVLDDLGHQAALAGLCRPADQGRQVELAAGESFEGRGGDAPRPRHGPAVPLRGRQRP